MTHPKGGAAPLAPAPDDERPEAIAYWRGVAEAMTSTGAADRIDVTSAVMREIAELEPLPAWLPGALAPAWSAAAKGARRAWSPRPLSWVSRPAVAFAGAAALALLAWTGGRASAPAGDLVAVAEPVQIVVQFRLAAEGARDVALAGDFTDWQPSHRLYETAPGVWAIAVPLTPGVYDYAFVVDGTTWRADPLAEHVADGFGGVNSRVAVFDPTPHRAL